VRSNLESEGARSIVRVLALCLMLPLAAGARSAAAQSAAPFARGAALFDTTYSAAETEVRLSPTTDSLWLSLPQEWVDPRAFALSRGDTLFVRAVDYLLDARRGRIRLLKPRGGDPPLLARYRFFPAPASREVRLYRPAAPFDAGDALGAASSDSVSVGLERLVRVTPGERRPIDTSRLRLAGSKTFAIETGTQKDLSLDQSLDLTVRGQVGRDVQVRAVLTDRQSGLAASGSSAALQDLDRVLVEVEGPRARMTLGDFALETPPSAFAAVRRQLEGASAVYTPPRKTAFGAFANSAGRLTRFEFLGEDGKQGPYRLVASVDEGASTLVVGSERVTLDDRRLARGESDDYLIDYAEGTIRFTARRPITAYSRIAVDCQVSADDYRRSVTHAGATFGAPVTTAPTGRVLAVSPDAAKVVAGRSLRAFVVTEGDDRGAPLGLALSEREKTALRAAGDSLTADLASGIQFVGPGLGDYERVESDTVATPFFRFVGREAGSYDVAFRFVGAEEGDYADTTTGAEGQYFRFVGRDLGDYDAGRELPRPQSARVLVVAGDLAATGDWRIATEVAVSDFDANTFSSRDDGDNQGLAAGARVVTPTVRLGSSRARVTGEWREVGRRFRPLDRIDPAFDALDWNVDPRRLERGERRGGLAAEVADSGLTVRIGAELLDNLRDFEARRGTVELQMRRGPFRLRERSLVTQSEDAADSLRPRGLRATHDATLGWAVRAFEVETRYRHERTRRGDGAARSGDYFHETGLRVSRSAGRWNGGIDWGRRESWRWSDGAAQRSDLGSTWTVDLDGASPGGRSLGLGYVLRHFQPRGAAEQTRHLGRAQWALREFSEAIVQEGRLEVSTSEQQDRRKEIVFVGEGLGHYDEQGVYQGIGDYEVFYFDRTDERLVQRVDLGLRTELDRGRAAAGGVGERPRGVWGTLRVVHYWTALIESERTAQRFLRALPELLLGRMSAPRASVQQRLDLSALPSARFVSPRLRLEERRTFGELGVDSREAGVTRLAAIRNRAKPTPAWSVDLEQEWDRETRELQDLEGAVTGEASGWSSRRLRLEQRFDLGRGVSLGLDLGRRLRDRLESEERARIWEATPSALWTGAARTRVELRATRLSVDRENGVARPDRTLERSGWTSRLLATVRLGASFDLSSTLRETRPDEGRTIRDARVELRASF